MRCAAALFLMCALISGTARAALDSSPFPVLRPAQKSTVNMPKRLPVFGPSADTVRPRPSPRMAAAPAPVAGAGRIAHAASAHSLFPRPRPAIPRRKTAISHSQPASVVTGRTGAICGDRAIQGQKLSPIPGKLAGCGISKPVRVASVDGVALSPAATMDCDTAKALKRWVRKGLKPEVGRLGGGVKSLRVIDSYSCRTRNSKPGAKISEHGHGKAVDIAAINLRNGTTLTVLSDWNNGAKGKLLHKAHDNACGPFGTVLGPNSDSYHQNHFHLDTASYRSGPYCR